MFELRVNVFSHALHDPLTYQVDIEELGQLIDTGNY